jgi:predicted Zn-dependent protease
MVGGHPVEGRFVAGQAYAAYLKGVVLESEDQIEGALAAYDEAIAHDPDSAELWTRIGVLRCAARRKPDSAETGAPWEAFDRAVKIDPEYDEAWTGRARCHLKRGEVDAAVRAARVAVALDPDGAAPSILLAQALERQSKTDEARRWLDGLIARNPSSVEAHEAVIAFAARTHDEPRRLAAEEALVALRPTRRRETTRDGAQLSAVDAALTSGDFDRARRLGLAARISSGAVALRAAALGKRSFALSQAELVLAADPTDGDARVAAIVAADLARDDAGLARTISALPAGGARLSPLATLLLAELLERRVGPAAKSAWMQGEPVAAGGDALVEAVARRMRGHEPTPFDPPLGR